MPEPFRARSSDVDNSACAPSTADDSSLPEANANRSPANGSRQLRMALCGGGGAGFIGKVHRVAATMDGRAVLVSGAFSSNADRSRAAATAFHVDPQRAFDSCDALIADELARPQNERADFISIATPNDLHFPMAAAALRAGFHVICDKPMTIRSDDAGTLVRLVEESGRVLALTHNYTGYPMIRQAREMIALGELGRIRAVRASYLQGWMRAEPATTPPARGQWKDDPERNGPGATIGDIGTHAYNLARYVTGLRPRAVLGQLTTFSEHRQLDDYGHVLIRCEDEALIMLTVSQVTHGRLNDLTIDVDGERAALTWRQEFPDQLIVRRTGQAEQIYHRHPAADYMLASGRAACRLPGGHPEAFFEAFANVYAAAFDDMLAAECGGLVDSKNTLYPNVYDGLEGVQFIEQVIASSRDNSSWQPLTPADR